MDWKVLFKSCSIIIPLGLAYIYYCFTSSKLGYSNKPYFLGIWHLIERLNRCERCWIRRHFVFSLGARPNREQIKRSPTSYISVRGPIVIWFSNSIVNLSGYFVADGKLLLMILCYSPLYPSLAPHRMMLRFVSW